jgi:RimJ/RimL family protein N-acetyltransferase
MRLIGEEIIIRDLSLKDLNDYYEYAKCEDVGPNAGWKPIPDLEICKRVLSGNIISKDVFAIALKDTNKLIGTISLYNYGIRKYNKVKSLGFSLNKDYWNHGYMTQAVKLLIAYVFGKTDCEVLEVGHHSDNFASKRVIEKCGFNYDGRLCKYKKLYNGRLVDADFYSMTREDYERMKRYE